ncbi:zf-RVT domain-containing protein [Heracleum sosnowskyi]|uniref:Zf-RVT domain-containing protein n=1 Tax=Heracleum sosnowskyi TaxID=360622 RepID=A0AAD8MMQ8_9APIA|nr:zf-RVT domain-containing protein [Heracleum sosnowskyi]
MKGLNEEMKVSELIQQPGKWNRDLIQQLYLIPDSQLILSVPLSPFDHEDSWLWHYNKNGSYSVKSGYKLALSVDRSSPSSSSEVLSAWWKAFWAIQIPKKILIFGWRGFHEILPTTKGLHRRNVSTHSNFPLCGYGEDSNAHAVFWCPFAQEVWVLFEYQFMVGHKEDISFKDVLFYNTELLERELFDKMLIIAWGVWTERNKRTHGEAYRTAHQVKIWLTAYQEEIKSVNAKSRVLTGKALTHINQMEVGFQELTLCVDAVISTESEMIGLGAVIFVANKKVQASLAKPMEGSLSVFHAEALALLVGLHWAQTIGLSIKIILSDSLSLVQALDNSNVYQNELRIILGDIKMLLSNFPGATISHVSRKFNDVAHNLSKHALQLDEEASWVEEFPQHAENLI